MGTIPKVPVTRKGDLKRGPLFNYLISFLSFGFGGFFVVFIFVVGCFVFLVVFLGITFVLKLTYFISHDPPAQASSPAKSVSSSVSVILVRSTASKCLNNSLYLSAVISSNGA